MAPCTRLGAQSAAHQRAEPVITSSCGLDGFQRTSTVVVLPWPARVPHSHAPGRRGRPAAPARLRDPRTAPAPRRRPGPAAEAPRPPPPAGCGRPARAGTAVSDEHADERGWEDARFRLQAASSPGYTNERQPTGSLTTAAWWRYQLPLQTNATSASMPTCSGAGSLKGRFVRIVAPWP